VGRNSYWCKLTGSACMLEVEYTCACAGVPDADGDDRCHYYEPGDRRMWPESLDGERPTMLCKHYREGDLCRCPTAVKKWAESTIEDLWAVGE